MFKNIQERIDKEYKEMVNIRRYLHQHPELSFQEHKTAAFIANFYEELKIPFKKDVGGNGVIATLKGGKPGKTVALRADFDALPIQDEKDVSYRSKVKGVMHACGHDGHTATLLSLAKVLKEFQEDLPGTIIFLHQHAEEMAPGGAKPILQSGALDAIDAIFGAHLWATSPVGTLQTNKDVLMAGADRFEIILQGRGGHGAAPHETNDAIMIGTEVVTKLQTIISRRIDPLKTAVLSIGVFKAGHEFNIIADQAKIVGTVRYLEPSVQQQVMTEMEKMVQGICDSNGATYTLHYEKGYPPLVNHTKEAEYVLQSAKKIHDIHTVEEIDPVMGAEDFAYYLLEKPGAYFFVGAKKEDHAFPHHHPKFDFDEKAMPIAAKMLVQSYITYQAEKGYR